MIMRRYKQKCSWLLLCLVVGFLLLPLEGLAQKKTKKPRQVYEKETVIRFDDTEIKGQLIKPDGFFLLRKRPKRWQDLIKIRESYVNELVDMKNDV